MTLISSNIEESVKDFSAIVGPERNFDIIQKQMIIGGRLAEFFMIDGFVKDEIMEKLLESFSDFQKEDMPKDKDDFMRMIPYTEASINKNYEDASTDMLKGMTCLFIDGYPCAFMIDCRTYPARNVSEPWKNRVLRGSRDGFVETIVSNVTLIRRRIRTPDFCVKACKVGTMSQTDVVFAYIQGKADEKLLNTLVDRLEKSTVEAVTMNIESLAEVLLPGPYTHPNSKITAAQRCGGKPISTIQKRSFSAYPLK